MFNIRTILGWFVAPTTLRAIFNLSPTPLPFLTPVKGLITAKANLTVEM
jgi:hypothetical protein